MSQLPRPEPVPASRAPEPQPKPVPVPAAPASFVQFPPRLHNEVYPFIAPSRFRGALGGSVGAAGSGDAGTVPKVVLITGAAGTLGSALAECFAITGAKLVLTYNRTPLPDSLRQRCFDLGAAGVRFAQCNVTDLASCEQLISNVLGTEEDGVGGRIDVLVNNAGSNDLNPVHLQAATKFADDVATNLLGPYYLTRLVLPHLRDRGTGVVLNVASRAGTLPVPFSASYAASKAALINFTATLQAEIDIEGLGEGIQAYSLHPGGVKSAMVNWKYSDEKLQVLPQHLRDLFTSWRSTMYIDSPYLNGMTCVALACGIGKDCLRGRYIDVNHDLEDIVKQADAIKADKDLYGLVTKFPGGMKNDGGGERVPETPFEFPGW